MVVLSPEWANLTRAFSPENKPFSCFGIRLNSDKWGISGVRFFGGGVFWGWEWCLAVDQNRVKTAVPGGSPVQVAGKVRVDRDWCSEPEWQWSGR